MASPHLKNVLIVDLQYSGHHQEYFNHCFNYLEGEQNQTSKYYFLVSSEMDLTITKTAKSNNIQIIQVNQKVLDNIRQKRKFLKDFYYLKIVKKHIRQLNITEVLFLEILLVLWGLPFSGFNTKISGVLLKSYYNNPESVLKKDGLKKRLEQVFYFSILRKKQLKRIFVLNNQKAVEFYNDAIAKKFILLPEPIDDIIVNPNFNLRKHYGIAQNKKILLHFGVLNENKGIFEIIEAIDLLPTKYLEKVTLIIAGKTSNKNFSAKTKNLVSRVDKIKRNAIILDIRFIEEKNKANYFNDSDLILVPYNRPDCSSGIFGYALKFKKLMIGPKDGLLSELIKNNNAGIASDCSSEAIKDNIVRFLENKIPTPTGSYNYIKNNTVNNFCKTLFDDDLISE